MLDTDSDSQVRSGAQVEKPKSHIDDRAMGLVEEVVEALPNCMLDVSILPSLLAKSHTALLFLGRDENWIMAELKGYPEDEPAPSWRIVENLWHLRQPITDLIDSVNRQSSMLGSEYFKDRYGYATHQVPFLSTLSVIRGVTATLLDCMSRVMVSVEFGRTAKEIFGSYQASVTSILGTLGIDEHLKSAYENLSSESPSNWQLAVLACRNILHALSDSLWLVEEGTYPYLKDDKGQPIKVSKDKQRNRIRAYFQQKKLEGDSMLCRMLDPLYAMASAGKGTISREHAESTLLLTYVFLGEMVRLTDMKPIEKLMRI